MAFNIVELAASKEMTQAKYAVGRALREIAKANEALSQAEHLLRNAEKVREALVRQGYKHYGDGGGKSITITQPTIRSSMTKEQYEGGQYSLEDYARDCFGGKRWQARKALNQYAAGVAPMPPMPAIEGVTAQQISDRLLDGYVTPVCETNILLTRILERLAVSSSVESPMRTKAEVTERIKRLDELNKMASSPEAFGIRSTTVRALKWVLGGSESMQEAWLMEATEDPKQEARK